MFWKDLNVFYVWTLKCVAIYLLCILPENCTWMWKNIINFIRKLQIIGIALLNIEKEKCCFVQKFYLSWAVHVGGKWHDVNMKLIKNMIRNYTNCNLSLLFSDCCHIYLLYISTKQQLNTKNRKTLRGQNGFHQWSIPFIVHII